MKHAGGDRYFLSVGTRKANERDRMCPIAGRIHKSNTQKYTVHCDNQVMVQGCWDSVCQQCNKNLYYQIQNKRIIKCGWYKKYSFSSSFFFSILPKAVSEATRGRRLHYLLTHLTLYLLF